MTRLEDREFKIVPLYQTEPVDRNAGAESLAQAHKRIAGKSSVQIESQKGVVRLDDFNEEFDEHGLEMGVCDDGTHFITVGMSLNFYQVLASKYAVYPGWDKPGSMEALTYLALGLAGETGEHAGKRKKVLRGDYGDYWPAKNRMDGKPCPGIDDDVDYRNSPQFEADSAVLRAHAEQKKLRIKELGDALWYISELARHEGISLGELARLNLVKLEHRFQEGTIKGDGDSR